jgi:hypothetical protein
MDAELFAKSVTYHVITYTVAAGFPGKFAEQPRRPRKVPCFPARSCIFAMLATGMRTRGKPLKTGDRRCHPGDYGQREQARTTSWPDAGTRAQAGNLRDPHALRKILFRNIQSKINHCTRRTAAAENTGPHGPKACAAPLLKIPTIREMGIRVGPR